MKLRLLTKEEIGNLEWESKDLEIYWYEKFAEAHPKEAQSILRAQRDLTKREIIEWIKTKAYQTTGGVVGYPIKGYLISEEDLQEVNNE